MKNTKDKYIISVILFFCLFLLLPHVSSALDLCEGDGEEDAPILVAFFNGVDNTPLEALNSLAAYRQRVLGIDFNGEKIDYSVFYNTHSDRFDPFGKRIVPIIDIYEAFMMRRIEDNSLPKDLDRHYEIYWADYSPFIKVSDKVKGLSYFLNEVVKKKQDYIVAEYEKALKDVNAVENWSSGGHLRGDLSLQKEKVYHYLEKGKKLLFVAHSQGNLFANYIYDNASLRFKLLYPGLEASDSIKVVHVAPASQTPRGSYVLADRDQVIKLLISHPNPNVFVPPYSLRSVDPERVQCGSEGDSRRHGFIDTYLNSALLKACLYKGFTLPLTKVRELSKRALETLKAPDSPVDQNKLGFFSVTLTMEEGPGLIALSVKEPVPYGKNVHFNDEIGKYGRMLLTEVDGHRVHSYKLNCDIRYMLGGVYQVGIAHYKNPDNKKDVVSNNKVRVEVKTFDGKVLFRSRPFSITTSGYESVFNAYHVLDIKLTWDFEKKKYDITLERVLDVREK